MKRVELWINNTLVDLNENGIESLFIISKQIQDIREPEKKQTDYSRNIQIPGSKNNDLLFSYAFELSHDIQNTSTTNFNPDFNPNLKATAIAYLDGVEFFNGIAQLTQVNVLHNRQVVYNITLLGKLANIFTVLGEKELREIDLSANDHTYSVSNIVNSWTINGVYVYPMIDYGFSPNLQDFSVNNTYPAIYVKKYIDKIFNDAGFTYTSTFLTSDFFRHLIIPFNSSALKLTSAQVLARKFRASKTSSTASILVPYGIANSSGVTVNFNDDSTLPNFDTSNQYNTSNGRFICSQPGVYTFVSQVRVTGTFIPATAGVTVRSQVTVRCFIEAIFQPSGGTPSAVGTVHVDIDLFTTTFQTSYTTANPASVNPIDPHYVSSPFNPRNYINIVVPNLTMGAGDQIIIRSRVYMFPNQFGLNNNVTQAQKFENVSSPGTFYDGSVYLNIEPGSLFYNTIDNTQIIEGQTVLMNNCIPDKVKQKDFLISIFRMFNLYVEQDTLVDNNLLIEDRNSYYGSTVIDLSQKRDISKELVIKPMGALDVRSYRWKYKPDTDYYNTIYNNSYPLDYGEREEIVNNDFIKGTKTTELIFSPTPSVGSTTNDRVIPRIIKVSDTGVVSPHEGNIRILYYGGLKDTNQVWHLNSSGQVYTYGQYPYCGHLDDPYNSTVDLLFYPPSIIYWANYFNNIWYTSNNLYNAHWKQFIEEVTDKNSKIVSAWFRLNALDIKNMDFRNIYYFDREYFRLNRIIDYNPVSEGLTQCEFIKIKAAVPFQTSSGEVNDALDTPEVVPGMFKPGLYNGNTGTIGGDVIVNGLGNRVNESARSILISGLNNVVGDYSERVALLNSSGVVTSPGAKGVTVFNTKNKRLRNDNVFMIAGQALFGTDSIDTLRYTGAIKVRDSDESLTTHLIDTSSGDVSVQLEDPRNWIGLKRTFKKISNDINSVILIPFSGAIENATSLSWNTYQASYTLTTDGRNYYITEHYG